MRTERGETYLVVYLDDVGEEVGEGLADGRTVVVVELSQEGPDQAPVPVSPPLSEGPHQTGQQVGHLAGQGDLLVEEGETLLHQAGRPLEDDGGVVALDQAGENHQPGLAV